MKKLWSWMLVSSHGVLIIPIAITKMWFYLFIYLFLQIVHTVALTKHAGHGEKKNHKCSVIIWHGLWTWAAGVESKLYIHLTTVLPALVPDFVPIALFGLFRCEQLVGDRVGGATLGKCNSLDWKTLRLCFSINRCVGSKFKPIVWWHLTF